MLAVGPDIPPALQPFAKAVVDAIRALQAPEAPQKAFRVPLAADLPPAAEWSDCVALVGNPRTAVLSTFNTTSSAWEWLRADGSAI